MDKAKRIVKAIVDDFTDLDSVVLQRDAAHKAMLAAERDRDYYLSQIRLRWKGVESSGIGEGCAVACSDGTRWKTVYEWRDAALKAEREVEELKAKRPK